MASDKRNYPHIDEQYPTVGAGPAVKLRCPYCGRTGVFEKLGVNDVAYRDAWFGQRRCPNDDCHGQIFFIFEGSEYQKEHTLHTYPPERPEFDREKLPDDVAQMFDEAITCYVSGAPAAAGMMLRRTLERVLSEQDAEGSLIERMEARGLPGPLVKAAAELQIFSGDAGRVDAEIYRDATTDEIEIAVELTREVLKSAYQYEDLLGRLKKLKDQAESADDAE